jgi:CRP-like cAMP-binding protein/CheY-like chemotaxis protein
MKKILLIEDNLDVRETTADILELKNYKVETAENGKLGVEKAKKFEPDVIICDIIMPELDGYGVLYLLSKDPKTASIPFIFLTAKIRKEDMRKGMNLGADDYLTKPFEEMELLDAIDSRLKRCELLKKEIPRDLNGINSFLNQVSSFKELKNLSKDRKLITYGKRTTIFSEGSSAHELNFIQSGKIKTFKTAESGKEFITGIWTSGDFLGALSLLGESGIHNESAVAIEDTKICSIPKGDFTKLIFSNKMVSNAFLKLLSNSLVEREEQLTRLAYDSVRQRIAKTLVDLCSKERFKNGTTSNINITREDLAGLIGSASETTVRALSRLKEDGLISIDGRIIAIVNKSQLVRVANSCYL